MLNKEITIKMIQKANGEWIVSISGNVDAMESEETKIISGKALPTLALKQAFSHIKDLDDELDTTIQQLNNNK